MEVVLSTEFFAGFLFIKLYILFQLPPPPPRPERPPHSHHAKQNGHPQQNGQPQQNGHPPPYGFNTNAVHRKCEEETNLKATKE